MSLTMTKVQSGEVGLGNVDRMMENALEWAAARIGVEPTILLTRLSAGDREAVERLQYALAKGAAGILAVAVEGAKSVSFFEPDYGVDPDQGFCGIDAIVAGVNLILWVARKTAAISSIAEALTQRVLDEPVRLGWSEGVVRFCRLNIHVVDDHEVRGRSGLGAALDSIYVRPLELWRARS